MCGISSSNDVIMTQLLCVGWDSPLWCLAGGCTMWKFFYIVSFHFRWPEIVFLLGLFLSRLVWSHDSSSWSEIYAELFNETSNRRLKVNSQRESTSLPVQKSLSGLSARRRRWTRINPCASKIVHIRITFSASQWNSWLFTSKQRNSRRNRNKRTEYHWESRTQSNHMRCQF